jgi:hypothetical protein
VPSPLLSSSRDCSYISRDLLDQWLSEHKNGFLGRSESEDRPVPGSGDAPVASEVEQ